MAIFESIEEFIWDKGNRDKNFLKHHVTMEEGEEVFFDQKQIIFDDPVHSGKEKRYITIGYTKTRRLLTIAFTIRNRLVRVISARDASRKERELYETTPEDSKI